MRYETVRLRRNRSGRGQRRQCADYGGQLNWGRWRRRCGFRGFWKNGQCRRRRGLMRLNRLRLRQRLRRLESRVASAHRKCRGIAKGGHAGGLKGLQRSIVSAVRAGGNAARPRLCGEKGGTTSGALNAVGSWHAGVGSGLCSTERGQALRQGWVSIMQAHGGGVR